jgi:hypothetical protein
MAFRTVTTITTSARNGKSCRGSISLMCGWLRAEGTLPISNMCRTCLRRMWNGCQIICLRTTALSLFAEEQRCQRTLTTSSSNRWSSILKCHTKPSRCPRSSSRRRSSWRRSLDDEYMLILNKYANQWTLNKNQSY